MSARYAATLPRLRLGAKFGGERLEGIIKAGLTKLHRGRLTVTLPSGNSHTFSGTQDLIDGQQFHASWQLHSFKAIRRMLQTQSVGFAESYIAGEWDSPDLAELLEVIACNMDALEAHIDRWTLVRLWNRLQHRIRSEHSRWQSTQHCLPLRSRQRLLYVTGSTPSMTYSSGLYDDGDGNFERRNARGANAFAQERKYQQARGGAANSNPDQHVLEIGCGWGGFAEFAAAELRLSRDRC